ncbi:Uncharacterized protein DAT39_011353 [Clarias magur]|uniref:Uncharacterized protein n=1 Tax=Clarias magur TaxID=1594786 RepID=A0A8J4U1B3_CLAMG|nr:Uncharacterized protein DAT39_011353 [Clarias magur]
MSVSNYDTAGRATFLALGGIMAWEMGWDLVCKLSWDLAGHWAGCGAVEAPGSSCLLSVLLSLSAAADSLGIRLLKYLEAALPGL